LGLAQPGKKGIDEEHIKTVAFGYGKKMGISQEEAEKDVRAVNDYTRVAYGRFRKIDADSNKDKYNEEAVEAVDRINNYLNNDKVPSFDGTIYRGLDFAFEDTIPSFSLGDSIRLGAMSSFSTEEDVAKLFAGMGKEGVVWKVENNSRGKSIAPFAKQRDEKEILVPKDTSYEVIDITEEDNGLKIYTLKEINE
jgi:hypothetical protein